ncbi:unnamed protein product [Protopolystoma xenopodis]|uniref:Uncharacterized protein n=1 Tax=Protopolystoma xenopodis TaxID=117903 RepID=A0A448WY19_9PLAT|nr:unnamed protein product [Protopolystoma xenopodis]
MQYNMDHSSWLAVKFLATFTSSSVVHTVSSDVCVKTCRPRGENVPKSLASSAAVVRATITAEWTGSHWERQSSFPILVATPPDAVVQLLFLSSKYLHDLHAGWYELLSHVPLFTPYFSSENQFFQRANCLVKRM